MGLFDGETFDARLDSGRLMVQLIRIRDYALAQDWITLSGA